MDTFFRRVWIPVTFTVLLVSLPLILFRLATRPVQLASVTNPAGTLVAQVHRYDGLLSIGNTEYVVSVKPVTFFLLAPFTPETEVVGLSNAHYNDHDGPQVSQYPGG